MRFLPVRRRSLATRVETGDPMRFPVAVDGSTFIEKRRGTPVCQPPWADVRTALLAAVVPLFVIACSHEPQTSIRVDHGSFVRALDEHGALRVERALREVLTRYPVDFPQPPPIDILLRAVPPAERDSPMNSVSYGGVSLEEGRAVVEVHPATLDGPRSLNDAELRSLLGHELIHGYQCVRGPCEDTPRELWRRETEALEWELRNMEEGVRREYREATAQDLAMFRSFSAQE